MTPSYLHPSFLPLNRKAMITHSNGFLKSHLRPPPLVVKLFSINSILGCREKRTQFLPSFSCFLALKSSSYGFVFFAGKKKSLQKSAIVVFFCERHKALIFVAASP